MPADKNAKPTQEDRLRAETEDMVAPKDKAEEVAQGIEAQSGHQGGKKTDKEHGDKSQPHSVRTA